MQEGWGRGPRSGKNGVCVAKNGPSTHMELGERETGGKRIPIEREKGPDFDTSQKVLS